MRLDLAVCPRRRPVRLASLDRARDGCQRAADESADLARESQQARGDALQEGQREGSWVAGMARALREGGRTEGVGPVPKQGLHKFTDLSSFRGTNSEKLILSITYDAEPRVTALSSDHCPAGQFALNLFCDTNYTGDDMKEIQSTFSLATAISCMQALHPCGLEG